MATSMFDVDGTYQHIRRPEPHKLTTVSPRRWNEDGTEPRRPAVK
jgi:hypothetical protein